MSLLETTLNTRDLGGKKTNNGNMTIYNKIYRSDYAQKHITQKDLNLLLSNKINTIIDMRTSEEINKNKNYFEKIDNIKYYNYPIEEGSQIPKTINDVPKSYIEISKSKNIKFILETIANSENGVLFHCSAGKDRTEVITAIIFMICDVSKDEIVKDYMISKQNLKEKFKEIKKNLPNIDINIIIPNESYIIDFLEMFRELCGDIDKYLEFIGLANTDKIKLRDKILKP